jgi:hypothetical protein
MTASLPKPILAQRSQAQAELDVGSSKEFGAAA